MFSPSYFKKFSRLILLIFLVSFEIFPRHPRQVLSSFILFTDTKLGKFLPANNDKAELKKPNFVGGI